jgi:hypothetical protein
MALGLPPLTALRECGAEVTPVNEQRTVGIEWRASGAPVTRRQPQRPTERLSAKTVALDERLAYTAPMNLGRRSTAVSTASGALVVSPLSPCKSRPL